MRQVREGLFLGDIMDALTVLQTPEPKVTHMLSVFADELLSSHQNFAPGNLCSLVTVGAADDAAPAALIAWTSQPGAPPLTTIPTGNPTNLESPDDKIGGAAVSQDAKGNDDGNAKAVESPVGGGTEVGQHAMANDEGNPKAVESPVWGGTQVAQDVMANEDGYPKAVESPVGGGTEVSQDAISKDDGNPEAVESPVGGGTQVGQDAMANEDGHPKAVESPVGGGTEVRKDAMAKDDGNPKALESPVGGGTEVRQDAMANDDGNPKAVESPVGCGTEVGQDAMAKDDGTKGVESPPCGGGTEVGSGPQIINNKQEAVVVKRNLVRKTVPLRDMESENLLDHLEACLKFIEEGRRGYRGAVLVHCLAGISRSASVITAYLMRTEKLSLIQALASLRKVSAGICPNAGFMEQLRMFEEMGSRVDKESPIYKKFVYTSLARGAGCSPGLSWLSFSDHVNTRRKGNRFKGPSSIMNPIYNVARPIKEKVVEKEVLSDTPPSGVPSFRVRITRLCGKGFNPK